MFSKSSLLELIAIKIRGLLPRTAGGKEYVVVTTDRYSMLTRALAIGKTFSACVANVFFAFRIVPYDIPTYVLVDGRVNLTSKPFATISTMLGEGNSFSLPI